MKKSLLKCILVLMFSLSTAFASTWPKNVTDILGNTMTLKEPPRRILLASGFNFVSLTFVHEDPASLLVGWGSDLKKFDAATYDLYRQAFPKLEKLATIGSGNGNELSKELIFSLNPDLVIFDAWQAPSTEQLAGMLRKSGMNVAYIDFYQSPFKHTIPSIRLLGQLLDREEKAEKLATFYQSHLDTLTSRLSTPNLPQPKVLLHAYPGMWACCWSSGSGGLGEYISLFKGVNIGAAKFPTANGGQLNLEYIIQQNPDIYIATGHSGVSKTEALPIGTGIDAKLAQAQLNKVISAPGLSTLKAVKEGHVYGFWNYFSSSPFNIVGMEVMAKWLQPELYKDINPQLTMDEMNKTFLPVPLKGTYWITLQK